MADGGMTTTRDERGRTVYVRQEPIQVNERRGAINVVPTEVERVIRVELRAAINSFFNTWRTECEAALRLVNAPSTEPITRYAWVSLAGNMLWAATAFVPQARAGAWAIRVMSVLGAGVPSIANLHQAYVQPQIPNSQNLTFLQNSISSALTAARDAADVSQLTDAAYNLAVSERGISEIQRAGEREQLVWEMIFSLPYQNRGMNIRTATANTANEIVGQVRSLYPQYQQEIAASSRSASQNQTPTPANRCPAPHHRSAPARPQSLQNVQLETPESFARWLFARPEYLRRFGLQGSC